MRAFDEGLNPIAPNDYQKKLCDAIVQVHFGLVHYFIKQEKKSVFTAVLHEMVVLRAPPAVPVNPLKHGRLSDSPTFGGGGSSKKN